MGSRRLIAVADTGPLIHLAEIESLLLLSIFDELHVPEAVRDEAKKPATVQEFLKSCQIHSLSVSRVTSFIHDQRLQSLQKGECESLCLCEELSIDLILTDDLAVRKIAQKLGLTPIGSLGVIVKAQKLGRISLAEAENLLIRLQDVSSLYVTRAIVEMAIERLQETERANGTSGS